MISSQRPWSLDHETGLKTDTVNKERLVYYTVTNTKAFIAIVSKKEQSNSTPY